ncbi:NmrA/HSCARG family protein [Haliscomenobacter hydrossis]|uniref:NmrA family protein n=1 Tax=Haliscomenobacter hydrossis (strain ATCC 27775 / DSM 1100 / LMG 10767 / O) TaxID=760192 RepID=F4KUD1_HALH1|nr:NmrA/HSCARG family protein [Haliscomenobacter hydrossis]AEE51213.1 NmrA family protein [Haliscomenobacter hydrossis DSM 1100]
MTLAKNKIILVVGATGKQGGAVCRHLIQAGIKVRALTRKPEGESAKALRTLGIEVVAGNLNDINSLDQATTDVYGVFAVTNFWEVGTGKKEVQQNKNLADSAKKHGVQHYVLASIARCDDNPNLAHFVTKYECEQYIQHLELPYTFLRAVYFMDNINPKDQGANFHWAILPSILGDETSLQMISTDDIGWFATNAFLHPEQFLNKAIDIAGDEVTYPQLLAAYKRAFNADPKKSAILKFLLMNMIPEIRKMFNWYREPRFKADIAHLKSLHPQLSSIEDYFRKINSTS